MAQENPSLPLLESMNLRLKQQSQTILSLQQLLQMRNQQILSYEQTIRQLQQETALKEQLNKQSRQTDQHKLKDQLFKHFNLLLTQTLSSHQMQKEQVARLFLQDRSIAAARLDEQEHLILELSRRLHIAQDMVQRFKEKLSESIEEKEEIECHLRRTVQINKGLQELIPAHQLALKQIQNLKSDCQQDQTLMSQLKSENQEMQSKIKGLQKNRQTLLLNFKAKVRVLVDQIHSLKQSNKSIKDDIKDIMSKHHLASKRESSKIVSTTQEVIRLFDQKFDSLSRLFKEGREVSQKRVRRDFTDFIQQKRNKRDLQDMISQKRVRRDTEQIERRNIDTIKKVNQPKASLSPRSNVYVREFEDHQKTAKNFTIRDPQTHRQTLAKSRYSHEAFQASKNVEKQLNSLQAEINGLLKRRESRRVRAF